MKAYTIKKATEQEKAAFLALGQKIVDEYERTHLGDEVADTYLRSGACERDLSAVYDNTSVILEGDRGCRILYKWTIAG